MAGTRVHYSEVVTEPHLVDVELDDWLLDTLPEDGEGGGRSGDLMISDRGTVARRPSLGKQNNTPSHARPRPLNSPSHPLTKHKHPYTPQKTAVPLPAHVPPPMADDDGVVAGAASIAPPPPQKERWRELALHELG